MPVLRNWTLTIDADMVLRAQGADPAVLRARNSRAVAIAEQAIEAALPLIEPVVAYQQVGVKGLRHERLLLNGGSSLSGPLIAHQLYAAQEVIAVVCTLGPCLEAYASECFDDDPAYGMALDSFGSVAVDRLGAMACNYFEEQAVARGMETTIPISPGLLDWPVAKGQRELFALVEAGEAGVRLNDSSMMIPHKSTSLVVGVGPNVSHDGRICDFCSMHDVCNFQHFYDEQ